MGERSKTLINSFSAAFKRLLKAIETHGHPDLADKVHGHPDLASKEDLDAVVDHYIPGSKRQCVLFSDIDNEGNSNFLSANIETVVDPDYSDYPETFYHLVHFDAGLLTFAEDTNSIFADNGFWTIFTGTVNVVAGGVASSNQIQLVNAKSSVASISHTSNKTPLYSDKDYWSESFVWTTHRDSTGNFGGVRNIFRHVVTLASNDISNDDHGLWLRLTGNGRLMLKIQQYKNTWPTKYLENVSLYVNKADMPNATKGLDDSSKHAIEIFYRNGKYSIWIDGVKKPLRNNSGTIISDINNEYSYGNVWVSKIPINQSSHSSRLFGGLDGGGCLGKIDEYSFKKVISSYNPAANPIVSNLANNATNPPPTEVGVNNTAYLLSEKPVILSASNGIAIYNKKIKHPFTFDNLPLNNRLYFYLENTFNGKQVDSQLKYSYYPPVNDQIYRYNYISQLSGYYSDTTGDIVKILTDNFGNEWNYDDTKVSLYENSDINGYSNIFKLTMKMLASDSFITSNIMNLSSRWTIQIAFKRNSANYGTLYQTADIDGVSTPGLKVEYLSPNKLKFTISVNGSAEESLEITDTEVSDVFNNLNHVIFLEFFYTGFKYGFRLGYSTYGTDYAESWVNFSSLHDHPRDDIYYLDFIDNKPCVFETGGTFDEIPRLTIGSSDATPLDLEILGFNVLPFVYAGIPNLSTLPNILMMGDITYLPDNIHYFNKSIMGPMYFKETTLGTESRPVFEYLNNEKNFVYFGHVDLDQGGIRDIISYSLNAKYESEWIPITVNDVIKISHQIGDNDIDVDVFLNKFPADDGRWLDAGLQYIDDNTYGVGIKDKDSVNLTLYMGDTSVSNLGSSPVPGTSITNAYMKVIVTRKW